MTLFKYDIKFSQVNRSTIKKKEIDKIKTDLLQSDDRFLEIFSPVIMTVKNSMIN